MMTVIGVKITDKNTGESYIARSPNDVKQAEHWVGFSTTAILGMEYENEDIKAEPVRDLTDV